MFKVSYLYVPMVGGVIETYDYCDSITVREEQNGFISLNMYTKMPVEPHEYYSVSIPKQKILVETIPRSVD